MGWIGWDDGMVGRGERRWRMMIQYWEPGYELRANVEFWWKGERSLGRISYWFGRRFVSTLSIPTVLTSHIVLAPGVVQSDERIVVLIPP